MLFVLVALLLSAEVKSECVIDFDSQVMRARIAAQERDASDLLDHVGSSISLGERSKGATARDQRRSRKPA